MYCRVELDEPEKKSDNETVVNKSEDNPPYQETPITNINNGSNEIDSKCEVSSDERSSHNDVGLKIEEAKKDDDLSANEDQANNMVPEKDDTTVDTSGEKQSEGELCKVMCIFL